jgi:hypothetical protein
MAHESEKERRTADVAMIVEMIDESMALAQRKRASSADAGMQLHGLHQ